MSSSNKPANTTTSSDRKLYQPEDPVPSVHRNRGFSVPASVFDEQNTVEVGDGEEKQSFMVYKDLSLFVSDYFRSALKNFREAIEGHIHLKDISPATFRIFLGWLHFGKLKDATGEAYSRIKWPDLLRLWIFDDKHFIPLLKNDVMDAICHRILEARSVPIDYFPYIFANTVRRSPLRRVFVDYIASFNFKVIVAEEPWASYWNEESLRELASAFLSRSAFFRQWTAENLGAWNICVYHEHGSDDGVHEVETDNKIHAGTSVDGDRGVRRYIVGAALSSVDGWFTG